jgi:hypothetical protein
MNREDKIERLQKWALEEMDLFESIQDVLLIESCVSDDMGCLLLDNAFPETCYCKDCLAGILVFRMRGEEPGELFLSAVHSPEFYEKVTDKTNDGRIKISPLF